MSSRKSLHWGSRGCCKLALVEARRCAMKLRENNSAGETGRRRSLSCTGAGKSSGLRSPLTRAEWASASTSLTLESRLVSATGMSRKKRKHN